MVGVQTLATGFGLVESPRWHDGRLWFSDWTAGEIRILGDGGGRKWPSGTESLPLCFDFQPDGTMLRGLRGDPHAAAAPDPTES